MFDGAQLIHPAFSLQANWFEFVACGAAKAGNEARVRKRAAIGPLALTVLPQRGGEGLRRYEHLFKACNVDLVG